MFFLGDSSFKAGGDKCNGAGGDRCNKGRGATGATKAGGDKCNNESPSFLTTVSHKLNSAK